MNEVSNQVFSFFDELARREGLDVHALTAGLPMSLSALRDPGGRFGWDALCTLCERVEERVGPEAMVRLGRGSATGPVSAPLRAIIGLFFEPRFAYRATFGHFVQSYYRQADFVLEDLPGHALGLRIAIRDGHRDAPRSWFLLTAGALEALPTVAGFAHARVTHEIGPRGARYVITPPRMRLRDRVAGLLRPSSVEAALVELERQQRELAASERIHRQAVENAEKRQILLERVLERVDGLIGVLEVDGTIRVVTTSVERALGHPVSSLIGRSALELVHPDDLGAIVALLDEGARAPGRSVQVDVRLRAHDGTWREYEAEGANLIDDPIVRGILINARDVTARRAAERALRERDRAFGGVLRNLQGMAYRCRNDADWTMELVSPGALAVTGYDDDELIGNRVIAFNSLIHPDDAGPLWDKCQINLDARRTCNNEYRIRHKNGSWRWVVDLASGVYSEADGSLLAIEGFVTDVTERHQLEERLAHSQRLEGIGRLAGGVAHDFNNLLGAMLAYAELAARALPPGHKALADIDEISAAAERAAELTGQLLAFARKRAIQPTVVDLNEVLVGVDRLLRRVLGDNVELESIPGPGLWTVEADRGQLEQVLLNLAINARDAMPEGGQLTLETRNVELESRLAFGPDELSPGEYVLLAVTDTGQGMSAATQQHIFEPFFTTKSGLGTGLGLATCYGIVRQAGGAIHVYSELGRGTTFKVYLPRSRRPAEPMVESRSTAASGSGETLLLVEDHAQLRESMRRALSDAGYEVIPCSRGEEALAVLESHVGAVHLLVTDVVMPGMSGQGLADAARAERPGLKVLYMSGYTENAVVRQGIPGSGSSFLAKPFSLSELCAKVRAAIDAEA